MGKPMHRSTRFAGPWTTEVVVDNGAVLAAVTQRRYAAAKAMRCVRLLIHTPSADNFARIPEFEVIAEPVAPPPFSLAEFAACMAGPGVAPAGGAGLTGTECLVRYDEDGDGDVDLRDFVRAF